MLAVSISMTKKSSSSSCVQALYELCKKTFTPSGLPPPTSQAIQKLSSLLDTIGPGDVGLKEDNVEDDRGHGFFGFSQFNRVARWAQPITFVDIYECDSFTAMRLAKLVVDKVLTAPCDTSALYPKYGGNLHCFTAVSSCAVLDILAPPYLEAAGRKCTYYHDYPYSSIKGNASVNLDGKEEEFAWLKEIDTPEDLYMRPGIYTGPAVQV
ncbi:hypothetical protein AQUCO_00201018v1 [Aquilegia coerulea]|uniref:cysteine dioxygenase n=1 Tax=Aquilegia coerulea TaxID=218851 RepID=A0A2G5F671_AQUCA|nr:hypothetical protein AQUCO_00201018v1 [Aquilegia coerulea]